MPHCHWRVLKRKSVGEEDGRQEIGEEEEEEGFEVRNEKTVGGRSQNHVLHEKLWNTTLL